MSDRQPSYEVFTKTRSGVVVYFDPVHSHLATHFADTPQLEQLVREIFKKVDIKLKDDSPRVTISYDFGEPIGKSDLAERDENDEIIYAIRKNRDTYGVFVKNKNPVDTSVVTLVLNNMGHKKAELFTAWVGPIVPAFPSSESAEEDSVEFWNKHALAWGNQEVIENTITDKCPW